MVKVSKLGQVLLDLMMAEYPEQPFGFQVHTFTPEGYSQKQVTEALDMLVKKGILEMTWDNAYIATKETHAELRGLKNDSI